MSDSGRDNERKVEAPSRPNNSGASAAHRGGKGRTKGKGRANKVEGSRSATAAEPVIAAPEAEARTVEPAIAYPQATAPEARPAIPPPKPEAPKTEAPNDEAKAPVDVRRTPPGAPGEVFVTLQALSVKWAARGLGWGCVVLVGGARALENGAKVLEQAAQRLNELQEKIKNEEVRAAV